MTTRLEGISAVDAAAAIRRGDLSPVEYTKALLHRIDSLEARIHAWVTVDSDGALAEARVLEAEALAGNFRGVLHGVPVGIKDVFDTAGLRTTRGSRVFEHHVPEKDAEAVRKLKQAGAIVLGKTVTTEFAYLDPGPTRNAWSEAHTPGGSSSGSAAAVAARMCPVAIGSQTVGSIGRPAAYNGIAALMPTQRRISRAGSFPDSWSLDHVGPLARTVGDIALMCGVMSAVPIEAPPRLKRIRIGALGGFFLDNATEESRAHYNALIARLAEAGFEISEPLLPSIFSIGPAVMRTILRAEIAAAHEPVYAAHRGSYGPKIRALVETGLLLDAGSYLRARRIARIYRREMETLFNGIDVLMTPGARGPAPEGMATGDSVMQLPWALADFPTLSLPHAVASNGLPLGIQVTAPSMSEGLLFAVGSALEAAIGFTARPAI